MNTLSLFDDDKVPAPGELPVPRSVTSAPERLNLAKCINRWYGHQHQLRLMGTVWRAEVGTKTMSFVVTQFFGFGAESGAVPAAHDLKVDSVRGAARAIDLLAGAATETRHGQILQRADVRRLAHWCGEAQWPGHGPDCAGRFGGVPTESRAGAFAAFHGALFDRNLLAQIIETLGAFYECDQVRYSVVNQERNALLFMRGLRSNKAPGWRLFLSGIDFNSPEEYEVFDG